jgi:uncharacterized protein (TIGR03083 family)
LIRSGPTDEGVGMGQTKTGQKPDYDALRLAELASISEYLHELSDEQWDTPSLCDGWRVRDVVSHMCVGYTTPMPSMLAKVAKRGFSVPRASREESIAFGTAHSPQEILALLDAIHTTNIRKGIAKVIKPSEGLVDHVIHHQDIRRPLGRPRAVPEDRLRAALDVMPGLAGFVGAKARVAGLRLVATDLDWSHGSGPEVSGAGEALLLAASGRTVTLDELSGEGVAVLRQRLAA